MGDWKGQRVRERGWGTARERERESERARMGESQGARERERVREQGWGEPGSGVHNGQHAEMVVVVVLEHKGDGNRASLSGPRLSCGLCVSECPANVAVNAAACHCRLPVPWPLSQAHITTHPHTHPPTPPHTHTHTLLYMWFYMWNSSPGVWRREVWSAAGLNPSTQHSSLWAYPEGPALHQALRPGTVK